MEEQKLNKALQEALRKTDVSDSASNGFRPNVCIHDELEDLKRRYAPEQLRKIWEDVRPKSSKIKSDVIFYCRCV